MNISIPGWYISFVLLLITCQFITSCEEQLQKKQVHVSGVEIDRSEVTLLFNDTVRLKASALPEDATDRNVEWSSGNYDVATVDSCGLVTVSGVGNCIITVTTDDSGYTATCNITVPEQPAEEIDVTSIRLEEMLTLVTGEVRVLVAVVEPENATNQDVIWNSSDESIVLVDNSEQITGMNAGTACITVTTKDGTYQSTCNIIVKDLAMSGLYRPIKGFLKTDGNVFTDDSGQEVAIRGIGNIYTEQDFKNVASIGFNNIRYYLFAKDYEVNEGASYNWTKLNNAVTWTKKYNLALVLAMMDWPGTNGPEFFTNISYQDRLVNFWRVLTDTYKDETAISAYGLMNEPPISVDNPENALYSCGNDQNSHHPPECGDNGKFVSSSSSINTRSLFSV